MPFRFVSSVMQFGAPGLSSVSAAASLDPDATALIARMTVPPDGTRQGLIDTLVKALKAAGVWSKLDCFYVPAAHDAQAGRLNWKGAAFDLTAVNSPTFTVDRGYTGNGTTNYLDAGFNPATAGGVFVQDSAHLGVYVNNTAGNPVMGNTSATILLGVPTVTFRLNAGAGFTGTVAVNGGHTVASRTGATALSGYRDGVVIGTAVTASTAVGSEGLHILRRNQGTPTYSTARVAAAHWGSGLVDADASSINTALRAYLGAIGGA